MAHRLSFRTDDEQHCQHYELAHVILMTNRVPLSESEQNRLGDLQDEWESLGTKHEDELVVNDRGFSAHRHTLRDDAARAEIVLEDAMFDVLKKVCTGAQLSGHVARPKRALVAFLETAEKGKTTSAGFVPKNAVPTDALNESIDAHADRE